MGVEPPAPRSKPEGGSLKKLSIALAVGGLLLSTLLIGWFGFDRVITAIGRVGWGEFAVIIGWQLVLFIPLGLAWAAIVPPREKRKALVAGVDAAYKRPTQWKAYSRLVERVLAEWAPTRKGARPRRGRTS